MRGSTGPTTAHFMVSLSTAASPSTRGGTLPFKTNTELGDYLNHFSHEVYDLPDEIEKFRGRTRGGGGGGSVESRIRQIRASNPEDKQQHEMNNWWTLITNSALIWWITCFITLYAQYSAACLGDWRGMKSGERGPESGNLADALDSAYLPYTIFSSSFFRGRN